MWSIHAKIGVFRSRYIDNAVSSLLTGLTSYDATDEKMVASRRSHRTNLDSAATRRPGALTRLIACPDAVIFAHVSDQARPTGYVVSVTIDGGVELYDVAIQTASEAELAVGKFL